MIERILHMYFNTSHVSINLEGMTEDDAKAMDFNTSHVSINPNTCAVFVEKYLFQYISCFY